MQRRMNGFGRRTIKIPDQIKNAAMDIFINIRPRRFYIPAYIIAHIRGASCH